jgi:hypothetical protein
VLQRELASRIASLYRAVVRAVQSYVRQLSDVDVCPNVTSGCGDLIGVVRGLLSCSQLLNITLSPDSMSPLLDEIMVCEPSQTSVSEFPTLGFASVNSFIDVQLPSSYSMSEWRV